MSTAPVYPSVPSPNTDPQSLRDSVLALKQGYEALAGQTNGSQINSAITWSDLVALGVISSSAVPVGSATPSAISSTPATPSLAQGRLTLVSTTPVMTTTQSGKTTIYYTPYTGLYVPIYNGSSVVMTSIGSELSNVTTASSAGNAGPAAVTTNSNYDLFVWLNGTVPTLTRGPAWSSGTSRGTGAGTTELQMINGVWTNKQSITNGPDTNRGTYVGTVRSNGSSQIDFIFGAVSAGPTAASFGVWNLYNRVRIATTVGDTTDSWTYNVANTWRAPNANTNTFRVSFVRGMDEDSITASYSGHSTPGAGTATLCGIGLDSTTAFAGTTAMNSNAVTFSMRGTYVGLPGLGSHFVSAIELNSSTTASTWYGDGGLAYLQTGLFAELSL